MATDSDPATVEETARARLRFALGITIGFGLGQLLGWPLAFLTPVLAATFLRMPAPLPFSAAIRLLAATAAIMLIGMAAVYFLLPYPLVAVIVIVVGLGLTFRLGAAGGSAMTVLLLLVALLILPLVGQSSPQIADLVAGGFLVNLALAVLLSWLGFAILPARTAPPPAAAPAEAGTPPDADRAALKMTLVVAPIALAYLAFGWSMVLTLLFSAIMAQQLSAVSGLQATKAILLANMSGAAIAIAAYFLLVAVPSIPFMLVLMLAMALLVSGPAFSGGPASDLWASAFSAVLVILGGSLAPLGEDADLKAIDRIVQIALAGIYIAGAYTVVEMLSRALPAFGTLMARMRTAAGKMRDAVAAAPRLVMRLKTDFGRMEASAAARSLVTRAGALLSHARRRWTRVKGGRAPRPKHSDGM